MRTPGQFSLACLFVEVTLVASILGLVRQALQIPGDPLAFLLLVIAIALTGAAYALGRLMLGASEPPFI